MWRLFQQKKRKPHNLVAEENSVMLSGVHYSCTVCERVFYSARAAQTRGEYCPGKRVYTEKNLGSAWRPLEHWEEAIPDYLMEREEIRATGRHLRKAQEPMAYLCYTLMPGPVKYIPLYDVREARELAGAIPLALNEMEAK